MSDHLDDLESESGRHQGFIQGLWIGWAIGTIFLMPIVILVVTR